MEELVNDIMLALEEKGWSVISGDAPLDYPEEEEVKRYLNKKLSEDWRVKLR